MKRQKAPSAKRCIKTGPASIESDGMLAVRKHRAPNGALKLNTFQAFVSLDRIPVRKHRAPNGALKLLSMNTKRHVLFQVRKHRAPNGALKHQAVDQPEQEV